MSFLKKIPALILCFCLITGILFAISGIIEKKQISIQVLLSANIFFFLLTLFSAWMQIKSMQNKNPNVFIRAVMGGMFLKMMVTAGALVIYYLMSGKSFDTKAVFISLFFYLIYLATEVLSIMKLNKSGHA